MKPSTDQDEIQRIAIFFSPGGRVRAGELDRPTPFSSCTSTITQPAGHRTGPPNAPGLRGLLANEKDVYGILLMKEPRANGNLKRGRRLIQRLSFEEKHNVFQGKINS